ERIDWALALKAGITKVLEAQANRAILEVRAQLDKVVKVAPTTVPATPAMPKVELNTKPLILERTSQAIHGALSMPIDPKKVPYKPIGERMVLEPGKKPRHEGVGMEGDIVLTKCEREFLQFLSLRVKEGTSNTSRIQLAVGAGSGWGL